MYWIFPKRKYITSTDVILQTKKGWTIRLTMKHKKIESNVLNTIHLASGSHLIQFFKK